MKTGSRLKKVNKTMRDNETFILFVIVACSLSALFTIKALLDTWQIWLFLAPLFVGAFYSVNMIKDKETRFEGVLFLFLDLFLSYSVIHDLIVYARWL